MGFYFFERRVDICIANVPHDKYNDYLLYYMRGRIVNDMKSSALSRGKIRDIEIGLLSKDKQFEFERFVNGLSETRNCAEQELSSLTIQRNKFIDEEIE